MHPLALATKLIKPEVQDASFPSILVPFLRQRFILSIQFESNSLKASLAIGCRDKDWRWSSNNMPVDLLQVQIQFCCKLAVTPN